MNKNTINKKKLKIEMIPEKTTTFEQKYNCFYEILNQQIHWSNRLNVTLLGQASESHRVSICVGLVVDTAIKT